jgi:hypothetical protein
MILIHDPFQEENLPGSGSSSEDAAEESRTDPGLQILFQDPDNSVPLQRRI